MELQTLLNNLYGVEQPEGCASQEIAAVKEIFGALPAAVEDFWRMAGHTKRLKYVQDDWIFPADYQKWSWPGESEHLILLHENQGCCQAVVRREDLTLPDPPVYIRTGEDGSLLCAASAFSEFLQAALLYEAVWQLDHCSEEFFWLSDEELTVVQAKLFRLPAVLRNWFDMEVAFFQNRPDNLVAVMDTGGEYQTLYGAVSEAGYAALLEVMEGLGEPV